MIKNNFICENHSDLRHQRSIVFFSGHYRQTLISLFKSSILILFLAFSQFLKSNIQAQSIGAGSDGSPSISGIINIYTAVTSDIKICQKKIPVKSNSGFSIGDLVLIIQMQGAEIDSTNTSTYGTITDYSNAGNFEYALIDSLGSFSIFLKNPVLRNFSSNGKIQLIRIPQYISPAITGTLTSKKWDGETGGILAFDASGTVLFNASINLNGKGFRGGKKMKGDHLFLFLHDFIGESYDPSFFSLKGEGIAFDGIFPFTSGRGAPANGGGGGNIHTAGGGGGSNYGCGGKGGWGYPLDSLGSHYDSQGIGGYPLNYSTTANKIFMGGGGGAGHEHYNNGTSGAEGGGIVIIMANSISGNSKMISSNGYSSASSGAYGDGTGGAGAGGTILLSVNNFIDTIFIYLKGGDGGSAIMKGFGPGGGGGGGTLLLSSGNLPGNIIISSFTGGSGGIAGGNFYGAETGCDGGIEYNFKIPFNNYYEGVNAGFTFSPSVLSLHNTFISLTNSSTGATGNNWDFGDGSIDNTINPTHTYAEISTYTIQLVARDSICSDTAIARIPGEIVPLVLPTEIEPDIFTPNGDGLNDYFYISGLDSLVDAELNIFNRWGNLIYNKKSEKANAELRWDGKSQPEGTYYYVLNYTKVSGEKNTVKGSVMLMR